MKNDTKLYNNITIEEKEQSEIEVKGEIRSDAVAAYKQRALKKIGEEMSVPGFRKGHIPENILANSVSEQRVLEEVAGMMLSVIYPQIVKDNNLKVLGKPVVSITKLAPNNPIGFTIQTAVVPHIELADYKQIAQDVMKNTSGEKIEVTDKEIEDAIMQVQESKAAGSKEAAEKLPELSDEYVKGLGEFKNVEDFKMKMKENILKEKEMRAREKRRIAMMERTVQESTISLPRILVESELDKMLAQFKDDIAQMKLSFKEYLNKIKKTEDDLRVQWEADAVKRAKLQLVLNEIARRENIEVPKENIEQEVGHLLEHYRDANPDSVRVYITTVLTNEKVFQFLENQK